MMSHKTMCHKQQGAALATTMIFLLVLTIIGISTMQNNRQDQRMATNIQELNHAFQYGESGLVTGLVKGLKESNELLSTTAVSIDYDSPDFWLCSQSDDPSTAEDCDTSSNHGNAAVITAYRGKGKLPPVNYSLESGFVSHYFFVTSRGKSRVVQSTHEVGVAQVGPNDLGN